MFKIRAELIDMLLNVQNNISLKGECLQLLFFICLMTIYFITDSIHTTLPKHNQIEQSSISVTPFQFNFGMKHSQDSIR